MSREVMQQALDALASSNDDRKVAAMFALEAELAKPAGQGWYCAQCERGVDPSEVTFREAHETCGRIITDDNPPANKPAPAIDMVLHCPKCGLQHIDGADDSCDWDNPPHRSHLCHGCGHIWRPADVPTNGVPAVATKGKADSPIAKPGPVAVPRGVTLTGEQLNGCIWALSALPQHDHVASLRSELQAAIAAPQPPAPAVDVERGTAVDRFFDTSAVPTAFGDMPRAEAEAIGLWPPAPAVDVEAVRSVVRDLRGIGGYDKGKIATQLARAIGDET
ncbi:hypothetical protein JN531_001530 [Flagellatimonas centrodinii]|uniref:hypothetical protein n=1 Tax=Flagellatimonas centrodinii TaxID=2806210 RepID=UPI001FEDF256|nr:hypothetical protein [Flagellatimonas centrodinii]ULQ46980.1 hypothetical protein JN531_001530 [Flagellatimonas centrodinii]